MRSRRLTKELGNGVKIARDPRTFALVLARDSRFQPSRKCDGEIDIATEDLATRLQEIDMHRCETQPRTGKSGETQLKGVRNSACRRRKGEGDMAERRSPDSQRRKRYSP